MKTETKNDLIKSMNSLERRSQWLISVLGKLEESFLKNKEEAKGFIKDKDDLEIALKALDQRQKSVQTLIESIKNV
jgi:hypothetical protein